MLCALLYLTSFAFADILPNGGNYTDSSIDTSADVGVSIGGNNSGDIHVGDNDTSVEQEEQVECEECLKARFDGADMSLFLPRVEFFDPVLFKVTFWSIDVDLSTGEFVIVDMHQVE